LIEIDLVAVKGKTQAGRVYTLPPEEIEAPPENWDGVFTAEEK